MKCEICYDHLATIECKRKKCVHSLCTTCYGKVSKCPFCRITFPRVTINFKEYTLLTRPYPTNYRGYTYRISREPQNPTVRLSTVPQFVPIPCINRVRYTSPIYTSPPSVPTIFDDAFDDPDNRQFASTMGSFRI